MRGGCSDLCNAGAHKPRTEHGDLMKEEGADLVEDAVNNQLHYISKDFDASHGLMESRTGITSSMVLTLKALLVHDKVVRCATHVYKRVYTAMWCGTGTTYGVSGRIMADNHVDYLLFTS